LPGTNLTDYRAVITGASSGIGAAMARWLARSGCDVFLTGRRADRLAALAAELHAAHGIRADWIALDLAEPGSAEKLFKAACAGDANVDILVNSAGFGAYQFFDRTPWNRYAEMIQLNVVTLAELTHRFLSVMRGRTRRCYILNVSSIAAFIPLPFFTIYGGTKAFIHVFTECLAAELVGTNVSCTSLCAGGTDTEFSKVAGKKQEGKMSKVVLMDVDRVASIGLRAMLRGRHRVVPGLRNRLVLVICALPQLRWMVSLVAARMLDKPAPPGKTDAAN
jgi:short-subunit dehydrogenase